MKPVLSLFALIVLTLSAPARAETLPETSPENLVETLIEPKPTQVVRHWTTPTTVHPRFQADQQAFARFRQSLLTAAQENGWTAEIETKEHSAWMLYRKKPGETIESILEKTGGCLKSAPREQCLRVFKGLNRFDDLPSREESGQMLVPYLEFHHRITIEAGDHSTLQGKRVQRGDHVDTFLTYTMSRRLHDTLSPYGMAEHNSGITKSCMTENRCTHTQQRIAD